MNRPRLLTSADQAVLPLLIGIDLGGTNIKIGLLDEQGTVLADLAVPTEVSEGPAKGVRRMAAGIDLVLAQAKCSRRDVARIGLATPGSMDIPAGQLLHPHNLPGWFNFPIRDALSKAAQLPVTFANDASAAAYGEFWQGTGRQYHSMILLTLGTGVGGGIIIGDVNIVGEQGAAAECGHVVIDTRDDARVCPCGGLGHLEAYAGATAVVTRTQEALDAGRRSSLTDQLAGGETLTPRLIAQEAEVGDELSWEIIETTARYLGAGIITLIHVINPSGVVLGGAMTFGGAGSTLGQKFLACVIDEVQTRGLKVTTRDLRIEFASLGGDAGYIGAAGLARLDYLKQSFQTPRVEQ